MAFLFKISPLRPQLTFFSIFLFTLIQTELTSTLSEEEQELLDQLKATQTRLDTEIEDHTSVLEDATIKRQNLQSLLEDNLIRRRNELTESSSRIRPGANNASAMHTARKEELEQKKRELEEATQALEDVEKQLAVVKATDASLRSEIAAIKNDLEKLKSQDAKVRRILCFELFVSCELSCIDLACIRQLSFPKNWKRHRRLKRSC
jgi:chromosome segregation ATPase